MKPSLSALLLILCLAGCQTTRPHSAERVAGIRLLLTPAQLDIVASRDLLQLTPAQKQQVLATLGKDVAKVRITYEMPDGELAEFGYNLALRDRANSIVVLTRWAMNPDEAAKKDAGGIQMIGTPEHPPKESASFLIDADGKIWRFTTRDEFAAYAKTHRSDFGYIDIHSSQAGDLSSLAYRDTKRFMNHLLSGSTAVITQ